MYEPIANTDCEKNLLSALLLNGNEAFGEVADKLRVEDFYRPEHRFIYSAMLSLYKRGHLIEASSVCDELARKNLLNKVKEDYVRRLIRFEYSSARIVYYIDILQDLALRRRLMEAGLAIAEEARLGRLPNGELLDVSEKMIMGASSSSGGKGLSRLSEVLDEAYKKIDALMKGGESGVASGYVDLDKVLNGFQESALVLLAARPSVGKTALALNMAINATVSGKKVAVFSLEMSKIQLAFRILSSWSGINGQRINSGNLNSEDIQSLSDMSAELNNLNLYIDDTAGMGLLEMRSKARRMQHENGLDMIIIDYLQLMQGGKAENRQQEISEISRGLKAMARELKVPVLALSQLSRSVEMRAEKKPMLSDLRESGSLEQDADVVMFLYRDEYYNRDDPTNENIAEVIIAKNRNGPTTNIRLHFDKPTMKFGNLTRVVED